MTDTPKMMAACPKYEKACGSISDCGHSVEHARYAGCGGGGSCPACTPLPAAAPSWHDEAGELIEAMCCGDHKNHPPTAPSAAEAAEQQAKEALDGLERLLAAIDENLPEFVLDDGSGDEANEIERVEYAGNEIARLQKELVTARGEVERLRAVVRALEGERRTLMSEASNRVERIRVLEAKNHTSGASRDDEQERYRERLEKAMRAAKSRPYLVQISHDGKDHYYNYQGDKDALAEAVAELAAIDAHMESRK